MPEYGDETSREIYKGRTYEAEKAASAKSLKQECVWGDCKEGSMWLERHW